MSPGYCPLSAVELYLRNILDIASTTDNEKCCIKTQFQGRPSN